MDLILLGDRDSSRGVTQESLKKIESSSRKWNVFTTSHNLDIFLRDQDSSSKIEIFSAFAYSLRHNYAGKTTRNELIEDQQFVPNSTLYLRRSDHWDSRTQSGMHETNFTNVLTDN